jgi:Arc/MetJ-type ribon-helix-helix transcriptional regulator
MTVALARDVEDFLQDQVRSGVCADASELVNDVIRSVREQQRKLFDITPELEAWLLEAADKPATPLTKADFNAIRCMSAHKSDDPRYFLISMPCSWARLELKL